MRPVTAIGFAALLPLLLATSLATFALAQSCPYGTDDSWTEFFEPPGIGFVTSSAMYQGDLYVSGTFRSANGVAALGVAKWDGTTWSAVGTGGPEWGTPVWIAAHNGSLFALHQPGTTAYPLGAFVLWEWDGATWTEHPNIPMSTQFNGIQAFLSWNGSLYAGGELFGSSLSDPEGVFRWNGSWSNAGATTNDVYDLVVHNGELVATFGGGTIDGVAAPDGMATFNGTTWTARNGLDLPSEMTVHNGDLYVNDRGAGPYPTRDIKLWTGTGWTVVGIFPEGFDELYGSTYGLVVSGDFSTPHSAITVWDGSTWNPMGPGVPGLTNGERTRLFDTPWGLLFTGLFTEIGSVYCPGAALWDGSAWSSPGLVSKPGLNGTVAALYPWNGDLVVAGDFNVIADPSIEDLARWDGVQWHALNDGSLVVNSANALGEYGGNLVLGGSFDVSGADRSVVSFDGSTWSALGTLGSTVNAVTLWNGSLAAGGDFDAGGLRYLAFWDGLSWTGPSSVIPPTSNGYIHVLHEWNGMLIVGGDLTKTGTLWGGLGGWDGTNWNGFGTLFATGIGGVRALATYQGDLVVGGSFVVSPNYTKIARWDGAAWHAFGTGIPGPTVSGPTVLDLKIYDGLLYAGGSRGSFTPPPEAQAIQVWDGSCWGTLGSGITEGSPFSVPFVASMAELNGSLYMGGNIGAVGGPLSNGVVRWTSPTSLSVDVEPVVPSQLLLGPVMPNPTLGSSSVSLQLTRGGDVVVDVLSVDGRLVARPLAQWLPAGAHELVWDGMDATGRDVAPGVYYLRVRSVEGVGVRKVSVLR